jgi:hypothetical protein
MSSLSVKFGKTTSRFHPFFNYGEIKDEAGKKEYFSPFSNGWSMNVVYGFIVLLF